MQSTEPIFDNVIKKFLNYENGVYIEAGANNGIEGSNTLYLERVLNWTGVLIEPSKSAFDICVRNRSADNSFANVALVGDSSIEFVEGDFDGSHMSSINGNRTGLCPREQQVRVEAATLTKVLDKTNKYSVIDFFSLDVEGYELEVLKGIDFNKYSFKHLLIEVNTRNYTLEDIVNYLEPRGYTLFDNITKYNTVDNPHWTGDHNDYLFIKV